MENVLDLYAQEPVPGKARICFDERPCQLLEEVVALLPMKAGKPEKEDYEYTRQGTAAILLTYDIDTGQRYTQVRKQRTKKDYAQFIEWLVEQHYSHVEQIELVQDNLNTQTYGSFYEHLPAERDLAQKLNFHFTPKHGSCRSGTGSIWQNRVPGAIEFSSLARECLDRRIDSIEKLEQEVLARSESRNSKATQIHWSFTVNTARQKLASQYEKVNEVNASCNN